MNLKYLTSFETRQEMARNDFEIFFHNDADSMGLALHSHRFYELYCLLSGNVGYMIRHDGINFCLITDAGHVTDEMKTFIQKANYLIIEANHDEEMLKGGTYPEYLKTRVAGNNGHLSNSSCAEALAENASPELKHVWLCHLSEENNHPELARKTVEMVLRSHGIIAGKDFLLDVLKRNTPSELYDLT